MNKNVLFISTLHRSSERFFEGFNNINGVNVTALNIGQASSESLYIANKSYLEKQKCIFSKIINGPGVANSLETRFDEFSRKVQKTILEVLKTEKYDLVVIDDDRDSIKFIKEAYLTVKDFFEIPFVSVREGVILHDKYYNKNKRYFDYLMCIGNYDKEYFLKRDKLDPNKILKIGIPENDKILNIKNFSEKYILLILNYVCKHSDTQFFDHNQKQVFFNKSFVKNIELEELQKTTGLKIIAKLKNRFGENMKESVSNVEQALNGLDFEIIENIDSDIDLIKDASIVISYGSNMVIKSMVMNKPTLIIDGMGHLSFFNTYFNRYNTLDPKRDCIINKINNFNIIKNKEFLLKNIEKSTTFDACDIFKEHINNILKGK